MNSIVHPLLYTEPLRMQLLTNPIAPPQFPLSLSRKKAPSPPFTPPHSFLNIHHIKKKNMLIDTDRAPYKTEIAPSLILSRSSYSIFFSKGIKYCQAYHSSINIHCFAENFMCPTKVAHPNYIPSMSLSVPHDDPTLTLTGVTTLRRQEFSITIFTILATGTTSS